LKLKLNGTAVAQDDEQASGAGDLTLSLVTDIVCGEGDTVTVTALQDSGASKNTQANALTRLAITQVR
jgi:hypothetical protein